MRKEATAAVIAILVVASLGIGYLAENPSRQTPTSTSTSQQTTASTSIEESSTASSAAISTVSSSGLELGLDLNATAMEPGQTLGANVTLFNTFDENLSLPLSAPANLKSQIAAWNDDDFECGKGGPGLASYVAGFALFKGDVSADNLSLAPAPLQLAEVVPLCDVSLLLTENESIVFLPHSENAFIPGADPFVTPTTLNVTTSCYQGCSRGSGLFGYWNRTSYTCCDLSANAPDLFRYLTPGAYTIAAEDLWGQTVFAYFEVTEAPGPSLAVLAQESPFSSEAHPIIGITLADFADAPITSLNATLRFVAPSNSTADQFTFGANSSNPLLPGQYVQDVRTFQGNLFDIGVSYPLTISGTLANGTEFAYTQQIQFVNSAPS
jgi:hypothetical protein